MKTEIEKAIRETLVISNPESIHIAVDKISKLSTTPEPVRTAEEVLEFADWIINKYYMDETEYHQDLSIQDLFNSFKQGK